MEAYDLVRYACIVLFGVGVGFMLTTNTIAWQVLRPKKQLGFLWWHVTSISIAWLLVGGAATFVVYERLGEPPGVLSLFILPGMALFMVAQIIIFSVERSRLTAKRSMEQAMETSRVR